MAQDLNIQFQHGYAQDSNHDAGWWSGDTRKRVGKEQARKLMRQWGLGYGSDGLSTIPYSLVRMKGSDRYVPCEDIENIETQSRTEYNNAYKRHKACGWLAKKCKGRAVIDKAKWGYIIEWSEGAKFAQSELDNYNTCDEEEVEEAIESVLAYAEGMLSEKDEGFLKLDNKAIAALCTVSGIMIALILIKSTR